ncbi:aminoglycoside phosphotransferase family protein [Auraticoccus monumenti]|uniref:Phosphotransferase enzyme family protein n=1 Tax=Auraticoccus monumenti TaxID=675864 RepID=A0A1G7B0D7_9ACTN|nr:hypothetical protein [Auraticoccus monumenti]SDE20578.1 hypothetical protein SAMN04489747_2795 [Auraticoccus monumenti]
MRASADPRHPGPSLPATYLRGRRTGWAAAPPEVQVFVQGQLGQDVLRCEDRVGGMSTGVAAVVHGSTRSLFVKAIAHDDNPVGHELYRREAAVAARLPALPHVPAFVAEADVPTRGGRWAVIVQEAVDGDPVRHPWSRADVVDVLDAWQGVAPVLHTTSWDVSAEVGAFLRGWRAVHDDPDDLWSELLRPWRTRLEEMDAHVDGSALHPPVLGHLDLRADNVLRDDRGGVWFLDWAHPGSTAPWTDPAVLLADVVASGGDRLDGGEVDVSGLWRTHPVAGGVDVELMRAVVVGLAAALHQRSRQPDLPGLPHRRSWTRAMAAGLRPFLLRHR